MLITLFIRGMLFFGIMDKNGELSSVFSFLDCIFKVKVFFLPRSADLDNPAICTQFATHSNPRELITIEGEREREREAA